MLKTLIIQLVRSKTFLFIVAKKQYFSDPQNSMGICVKIRKNFISKNELNNKS